MQVAEVLTDLLSEQAALDDVLLHITEEQWGAPTASPRWDVTDQVAHLTFFDQAATTAISDETAFEVLTKELWTNAKQGTDQLDAFTLDPLRVLDFGERIAAWRRARTALEVAASGLKNHDRVSWFGPAMGAASFLSARLMECWAHGQDIVDAVGAQRLATDRLRHVAQLGVMTRAWSYLNRNLAVPEVDIAVRLTSPSGEQWQWGTDAAACSVVGSAEDFCLVVTQRRNVGDTRLLVTGDAATEWMTIAQAFAGPPTTKPAGGNAPNS